MNLLDLNKKNFDEIIESYELVLVDFWANTCAPCKTFAKVYAEVAKKYPKVLFAKVNIETETELAADFNIRSVPFLMVLKKNIAIYAESGAISGADLEKLINDAIELDISAVEKQIDAE